MRSPAQNAQLALLLEVSGTPKPGNVDRHREYDDLRFEHFMAGAVGSTRGLLLAQQGAAVGRAFERGVVGMAEQSAGNTQFGALLALVPLVRAASEDPSATLSPELVTEIVRDTTVEDACDFYRAFEHVDVGVDDPPSDLGDLDVRRGARAESALRERGLTLFDVMELSSDVDGIAQEWTEEFVRSFRGADWIEADEGPISDRAADAYLRLLADEPDTFIVKRHDRATADEVVERAQAALDGVVAPEEFASELIQREINPGTTADITVAALFIALERGLSV